jgi:hypothetical protein
VIGSLFPPVKATGRPPVDRRRVVEDHGGTSDIPGSTATMHVYILDQEHAESAFAAGEFSNDVWGHLHPGT